MALIVEIADDICELVLAFTSTVDLAMSDPAEVEATVTREPRDDEAVAIVPLTDEVTAAVWELVLVLILAPVFVTTLPIDVEAVVTSDCSAREPEVKVASVRLRVA